MENHYCSCELMRSGHAWQWLLDFNGTALAFNKTTNQTVEIVNSTVCDKAANWSPPPPRRPRPRLCAPFVPRPPP